MLSTYYCDRFSGCFLNKAAKIPSRLMTVMRTNKLEETSGLYFNSQKICLSFAQIAHPCQSAMKPKLLQHCRLLVLTLLVRMLQSPVIRLWQLSSARAYSLLRKFLCLGQPEEKQVSSSRSPTASVRPVWDEHPMEIHPLIHQHWHVAFSGVDTRRSNNYQRL